MKKMLVISLSLVSSVAIGMETVVEKELDKSFDEDIGVIQYDKMNENLAGKKSSSRLIHVIDVNPVIDSIVQKLLPGNYKKAAESVVELYENCCIDQEGKIHVNGKWHEGMQKFIDYICNEKNTTHDTFEIIYMAYWLKNNRKLSELQKSMLYILNHKVQEFYDDRIVLNSVMT